MEHPELRWVDTATGGPERRGQIRDVTRWRPPEGAVDCYRSVFRFGEGFRQHVQAHRSVSGYRGVAYADWLPIDIDAEGDLERALAQLRAVLEKLTVRADIDLSAVRISFSGSKGFHVQIPTALFGPDPSPDLNRVFGHMVSMLLDPGDYDDSIYDLLRLFRVAGTRHGKSGLFKVPLTLAEARGLSAGEILDLAKAPRVLSWPDPEPCPGLIDLYRASREWASANQGQEPSGGPPPALSPMAKPCIAAMLEGVSDPGRHDAALRIASHFAHEGMPPEAIEAALRAWNARNKPPMDERRAATELPRIAREAAQYDFGCNDPVRLKFCGGTCQLRARRAEREQQAEGEAKARAPAPELATAEDAYRSYVRFAQRYQERAVSLGLPTVDRAIGGLAPGEVCEIMARAGVGKTALLVNVARHLAQREDAAVLFVSLEMPLSRLFQRSVQVTARVTAEEALEAARTADPDRPEGIFAQAVEQFSRVWYVDQDVLGMQDLEALIRAAPERIGRPLTAVLLDYLGRMRADRPGRAYEVTSEHAQRLKSLAKACDVPIIYLHQTSRGAGDGSSPLTLDAGRDSGVTEEVADVVIGLWRPDPDEEGSAEAADGGGAEALDLAVLKARNGQRARIRLAFVPEHMLMGEVEREAAGVVPIRARGRRGKAKAPAGDRRRRGADADDA